MTIFGWDASDFDWDRGPMDLGAARAAGIDFFTHKATEGTSTKHKHYGEALSRAKAAGVPFLGAYHVVRSGPAVAAQVDYLLSYVNAATPWWTGFPGWFWQVDLELWSYDQVPAARGRDFASALAQRTGKQVIIYASKGQYGDQLKDAGQPLWNANYGANASTGFRQLYADRGGDQGAGWGAYSGVAPVVWQFGSNAVIGSQHTCDANAFRGAVADFARLIGAQTTGGDMANLGYADDDGKYLCERERALLYLDRAVMGPEKGATYPAVELLKRVDTNTAQAAADAKAGRVAVEALAAAVNAAGGSVDSAAIMAHMDQLAAADVAQVQALQATIAGLRGALLEANAKLDAQLSPAERASLPPAGA